MALLLSIDDGSEVTLVGVFQDGSAAAASQHAWAALEQDAQREEPSTLELALVAEAYWDGFDEVRSPEHVNHEVPTPWGWSYTVRYVEVHGG